MILRRLETRGFRNLEDQVLDFHEGFNVLEGGNGHGKTNALEALYWIATLTPLRAGKLTELVAFGQSTCLVRAEVELDGLQHRLECGLNGPERVVRREGKATRAAAYFGVLSAILFTPEDAGLLRDSPGARRRYLDRAIFTGRSSHLSVVLEHRRALRARNESLRSSSDPHLLEAFEGTLAASGSRLVNARRAFVQELSAEFAAAYAHVAGSEDGPALTYEPSLALDDPEGHALSLAADRARDRERGFTARGPHADDLSISLEGHPARTFASQGQQRALVLALKVAEIRRLRALFDLTPVLLLDDVSSELDGVRNARLFEVLSDFKGQVFVTTTDSSHIKTPRPASVFEVLAGRIRARPHP